MIAVSLVAVAACSLAGLTSVSTSSSSTGGSTVGGSTVGGGGMSAPLVYEAEDAGLYGKFVVVDDPDASHGAYVIVPNGVGCSDGLSEVVFDVVVGGDGKYVIWARVLADGPSHDSFFVSADTQPEALFSVSETGDFDEEAVKDDLADVKTAIAYAWDAGHHQVVFKCREDGTALDRIRLAPLPP